MYCTFKDKIKYTIQKLSDKILRLSTRLKLIERVTNAVRVGF